MKKIKVFILATLTVFLIYSSAFTDTQKRFVDNKDGTVTDTKLGLMWAQIDNQGDISWNNAQQWVRYTFGYTIETQYQDWRLPTIKELRSLYVREKKYKGYETECGMTIKIIPQITLTCGWVWSSEKTFISYKVFSFEQGGSFPDLRDKTRAHRVLAVRKIR